MNATELIELFGSEFGKVFDADLFDIDVEDDTIQLAMDDWTLVIESWPDGHAFVALDDESESDDPVTLTVLLEKVFAAALDPLAAVNDNTGGRIFTLLLRSGDPLSEVLAGMLRRDLGFFAGGRPQRGEAAFPPGRKWRWGWREARYFRI